MFRHTGTKKKEIKQIEKYIPNDIKIIVEPFGGSCALSYHLIKNKSLLTFHINDLDPIIYKKYEIIQNNKWGDFIGECVKKFNDIKQPTNSKEGAQLCERLTNDNNEHSSYIQQMIRYRPNSKIIRFNEWDKYKKTIENELKNKKPFMTLDTIISNIDYKLILEKYKDNTDAFIFLDPPYLAMRGQIMDVYNVYFADNEFIFLRNFIKTCKCKIMLIVIDDSFMRICFENYIIGEYAKQYSSTKNNVKHLIITNYHKM